MEFISSFFYRKKGLIILFTSSIILIYLFFRAGIIFSEHSNPLANVLFDFIALFATCSFALTFAYDISKKQLEEKQKEKVISYIRNIRTRITSLVRLIEIIDKYSENIENELYKQYFEEVKNHIINVYDGIKASENDFKDLIGKELTEDYKIQLRVNKLEDDLQKKRAQKAPEEEVQQIRSDIIETVISTPIGGYLGSSVVEANYAFVTPLTRDFIIKDSIRKSKNGRLL